MNKAVRRWAGLSVIGLCLAGAVNASYAQDACLDARVTASDPGVFESFGYSVAVSGDTAIVGAQWDRELGTEAGAVYVFRLDRQSSQWLETQKLLALDEQAGDNFGLSVAMEDELALIGAGHVHDEGGDVAYGAVYVFRFDPDTSGWIEEEEILASDSVFQHGFGFAVSVSGDLAVIGAPGDDDNGTNAGAAYVFRFDPDTSQWVEEQKLLVSDPPMGNGFGISVAIFGDIAVIGAPNSNDACPGNPICGSGAAYVFRYDAKASAWLEEQKLLASDAASHDFFGWSVSISDEAALIGAKGDDFWAGSAYVFRFDPKTSQWVQEQKLLASDHTAADQFGRAVALDGETAVIGAFASNAGGPESGAAYVFGLDTESSTWIEQHRLLPQANASTNFFGWSVAIDGETAVIGAHGEDQQRGAAYVFDVALNCDCPQDLDADGSVGVSDFLDLLGAWGPCPPKGDCSADFDGSGAVGVSDFLALLGNWGPCS